MQVQIEMQMQMQMQEKMDDSEMMMRAGLCVCAEKSYTVIHVCICALGVGKSDDPQGSR